MARRTSTRDTSDSKKARVAASPSPPSSDEEEGIFTVERIVQKRVDRHGKVFYLIKWEGYPSSQNTWEAAEDVFAKNLIDEFEAAEKRRSAQTEDEFQTVKTPTRAKQSPPSPSRSPLKRQEPAVLEVKTISRDAKTGGLIVHFKMSDGTVSNMPTSEANIKYPQILLKFYESRLNLKDSQQKKTASGSPAK